MSDPRDVLPSTEAGRALLGPKPEVQDCQHTGQSWFDRSFCACGSMHDVCEDCNRAIHCPLDTPEAREARWRSEAEAILAI